MHYDARNILINNFIYSSRICARGNPPHSTASTQLSLAQSPPKHAPLTKLSELPFFRGGRDCQHTTYPPPRSALRRSTSSRAVRGNFPSCRTKYFLPAEEVIRFVYLITTRCEDEKNCYSVFKRSKDIHCNRYIIRISFIPDVIERRR